MKLSEINSQLQKLGKAREGITNLIDLAMQNEAKVMQAEFRAMNYKINIIMWVIVVIILGFLGKFLGGF